jgi:outer membrane protein assembly factor BamA
MPGMRLRPADVERAVLEIERFYREQGHLLVQVKAKQEQADAHAVRLGFAVERGPKVEIGTIRDGEAVGGRLLNKYTSELRWVMIQTPQLTAAPYLFLDTANAWDGLGTYNPLSLYRSGGVGVRLSLPILGMIELAYGYNFDTYTPLSSTRDGTPGWLFQFTIGQGFGQ